MWYTKRTSEDFQGFFISGLMIFPKMIGSIVALIDAKLHPIYVLIAAFESFFAFVRTGNENFITLGRNFGEIA